MKGVEGLGGGLGRGGWVGEEVSMIITGVVAGGQYYVS